MPTKKRQASKTSKSPSKSKRATTTSFHPLKTRTWPGGRLSALVLILVIAIGGGAYVAYSHAASGHTAVEMGSTGLCLRYSSAHNTMTLQPCSGGDSGQYWQISGGRVEMVGSNGINRCVTAATKPPKNTVVPVTIATCVGVTDQDWKTPSWSGADSGSLYNVFLLTEGARRCLVDPNTANGGTLSTVGCDTGSGFADQHFRNVTLSGTAPAPTPTPKPTPKPLPTPNPTPRPGTKACISRTFSAGASVDPCVSNIQSILNGAYDFYGKGHGGTVPYNGKLLTVDGSYGSLTAAQVKIFQNYFNGSNAADGVVGPQTWKTLCYVAYYHDSPGASDYKLAGCTTHSL